MPFLMPGLPCNDSQLISNIANYANEPTISDPYIRIESFVISLYTRPARCATRSREDAASNECAPKSDVSHSRSQNDRTPIIHMRSWSRGATIYTIRYLASCVFVWELMKCKFFLYTERTFARILPPWLFRVQDVQRVFWRRQLAVFGFLTRKSCVIYLYFMYVYARQARAIGRT